MKNLVSFYDRYHLKNDPYSKVISRDNFTYGYILEFLHKACSEGFAQKEILDVGCGVGTIALYLSQKGAKVTGIDISQRAIDIAERARKSLNQSKTTFIHGEVGPGKKKFDLATTFEVIEHIKDEALFLRNIHSNLKTNGLLVLSTPSKENLLYRSGFYQAFDAEVGHLRRYTQQTLRKLLEQNSFKIVSMRQVEGPLRNILFTTKLGFLIRFIRGPLVPLFHFFDTLSGLVFGFSDIQVIAQKV
jgi:2-polyprenyl-3-methyl-5-hydroxy-6-metoxy-1,4-benzoquinol methylase